MGPQLRGQLDELVVLDQHQLARADAATLGEHGHVLAVRKGLEVHGLELGDDALDLDHPVVVEPRPVGEVEAGALGELRDAGADLLGVGDRHGREVHVAVEVADVDAQRRRDHVVPGGVRREIGDRVVQHRGVPRRDDLRGVHAVHEPEHRVLELAAVLGEDRRVAVQLLPALRAGRGRHLERAREAVSHGVLLGGSAERCGRCWTVLEGAGRFSAGGRTAFPRG